MTTTVYHKALHHLNMAEYWQQKVEQIEREKELEAAGQQRGRMSRKDGNQLPVGYITKTLLEDNFEYTSAVGNRNGHQQRAIMYLLAVQAGIVHTNGVLDALGRMQYPTPLPSQRTTVDA